MSAFWTNLSLVWLTMQWLYQSIDLVRPDTQALSYSSLRWRIPWINYRPKKGAIKKIKVRAWPSFLASLDCARSFPLSTKFSLFLRSLHVSEFMIKLKAALNVSRVGLRLNPSKMHEEIVLHMVLSWSQLFFLKN